MSETETPPRRPRRVWRWILGILAFLVIGVPVLLVLVVIGAFTWANSSSGQAKLAGMAGEYVPGLKVEGLSGPLPGRIGVAKLTMADPQNPDAGPWLELQDARIGIDWSALLHRQFRIEVVEAARVALHRLPPPSPATEEPQPEQSQGGFSLPSLPVTVALERLAAGRIELGQPILGAPAAFSLDGNLRLDTRTADASGLQATIQAARLDGPGRADVTVDLAPSADRLKAHVAMQEPAGGVIGGLAGLPGAPVDVTLDLDGPAAGARFTLAGRIGEDAAPGPASIKGSGTVGMSPEGAVSLVMDGDAAPGPFLPADLREKIGGAIGTPVFGVTVNRTAEGAIDLPRLDLTLPLGKIAAHGTLSAEQQADIALTAAIGPSRPLAALLPPGIGWEALALDAKVQGAVTSPRLIARLAPTGLALPPEYAAQAKALLGETPIVEADVSLPGHIERFTLNGQRVTLGVTGEVMPELNANVTLDLPDLAPLAEVMQTPMAGSLKAAAHLTGALESPVVDLKLDSPGLTAMGRAIGQTGLQAHLSGLPATPQAQVNLTSTVENLPLRLQAEGGWDGTIAKLASLALRFGEAEANGQGEYRPGALLPNGQLHLLVPDLAAFAKLAGQPMAGRIVLDASSDAEKVSLKLDAPRVTVAGQTLTAKATADGTAENIAFTLDGQSRLPDGRDAKLTTRARLLSEATRRVLEIAALDLTANPFGLRLTAPGRVTIGQDGAIETPGLAFATRPNGSIRLSGRYSAEAISAKASLAGLDLAALRSALPLGEGTPAFAGLVDAEANVSGTVAAPVAQVRVNARNLTVDLPQTKDLPAGTLTVDGRYTTAAANATAQFRMGSVLRADARVNLPRGTSATSPLEANLTAQADIANLSRPALQGTADQMAGTLSLDIRGTGTVSAPVLGGQARLANASWRNPLYGIRYTGIEGVASASGNTVTIDSFRLRTPGNGTIEASGRIDAGAEGMPGDIRITARGAQPIAGDLGRVTLDADMNVAGPLSGGATIGGTVTIRRADLRLPENTSTSVPTLDPVRRRGQPPAPPPKVAVPAPPYILNLQVNAPQQVYLRWRGLDAEMGGSLKVAGTAQAPDVTGALRMRRGQLDLLDRRLTFSRGVVSFSGPVIPELDFLVTSTVQGTVLNIAITGQATDPKLTFSSSPELPQDEVLARLLFQRSTSRLSAIELAQLAAGLAGLAGALPDSDEGGFLSRVGRRLGLDRLGLGSGNSSSDTTSSDNNRNNNNLPSVEAGTYIGRGVYVGVEQGTEGAPRASVQVELTPRLKLESSTGGDSGERVGLNYEYEY
ncbi:translocation/assembly module TamB domain-containing protein [Acetobacteraceae bacterium H6797]|nr:translocation/assembly module TamB domain-containing protein [Acetobacteraceae bacterium H6797]